MIYTYVKKPPKVQAVVFDREHNLQEVKDFAQKALTYNPVDDLYYLDTEKDGLKKCHDGDYVVKLMTGGFSLLKADIFNKTYKKIEDEYIG